MGGKPLWDCWLVDGPPLGVLRRRELAERRVGPIGVVLDAPGLGQDLGLEETGELLGVQQLVTHPALKLSMKGFSHGEPGSM